MENMSWNRQRTVEVISEAGGLQRQPAQFINSQDMPEAMDTVLPPAIRRPEYLLASDRNSA